MDLATILILAVGVIVVVSTLLLWVDDRILNSVRRNEIENEQRSGLRDEE